MKSDGRRTIRFEREVRAVVSEYILRQLIGQLPVLTSVHRVQMSPDLRHAKVYMLLEGKKAEVARQLDLLESERVEIQHLLAKKMESRYTPQLEFFQDNSLEKVLKVDSLFQEISKGH